MVIGKNGEPKAHVPVDMNFHYKFLSNPQSKTLKTNKEGTIDILNTKNITYVINNHICIYLCLTYRFKRLQEIVELYSLRQNFGPYQIITS